MRISEAFPSNWLKSGDLQDKPQLYVISHVVLEEVGGDSRPVVYFQGHEKGLVLNKTNSNNIAHIYGDDTDGWAGRPIVLYPTMVDFQGRTVSAIRVRAPKKGATIAAPKAAATLAAELDDDIPF